MSQVTGHHVLPTAQNKCKVEMGGRLFAIGSVE